MGFRLVPNSVVLNDLERRMRNLHYFNEFGSFATLGITPKWLCDPDV